MHTAYRLFCHDENCETFDSWGESEERNCPGCHNPMQALPSPKQIEEMSRA